MRKRLKTRKKRRIRGVSETRGVSKTRGGGEFDYQIQEKTELLIDLNYILESLLNRNSPNETELNNILDAINECQQEIDILNNKNSHQTRTDSNFETRIDSIIQKVKITEQQKDRLKIHCDSQGIFYIKATLTVPSNQLRNSNDSECSHKGFVQLEATCWLNSVLNALFMPVKTREILIFLYHKGTKVKKQIVEKLTYQQIAGDLTEYKYNPDFVLMGLVYQKLIQQNQIPEINILQNFAILLKQTFARCLLTTSTYPFFKKDEVNFTNQHNFHYKPTFETICYLLNKYCDKNVFFLFNDLYNFNNSMTNLSTFFFKVKQKPLMFGLEHNGTGKDINRTLTIGNSQYELVSSIIIINYGEFQTHVVTGFICDETQYIYDSSNYITQDNWTNNNFTNYTNLYKKINNNPNISLQNVFLIYSLQKL